MTHDERQAEREWRSPPAAEWFGSEAEMLRMLVAHKASPASRTRNARVFYSAESGTFCFSLEHGR